MVSNGFKPRVRNPREYTSVDRRAMAFVFLYEGDSIYRNWPEPTERLLLGVLARTDVGHRERTMRQGRWL